MDQAGARPCRVVIAGRDPLVNGGLRRAIHHAAAAHSEV